MRDFITHTGFTTALGRTVGHLWRASAPLTAVGLGMLAVFAVTLAGLAVDPRMVTGAPAWLKPAKFAISTAIYALTFAWLFTYLREWPRLTRVVGWTTAVVLVVEVALIELQAARGVSSHFNVGTLVDGAIFTVMGVAILIAWAASIALAVALFRQRFADPAFGWALRLGLLITVLGSASGGLMTRPTDVQLAKARTSRTMPLAGAHTVGGPDGGPGVPGTGWSLEHGDIRVAHFFGLHAVQILPLIAIALGRVRSTTTRRRAVLVATASYGAVFLILLIQALGGQSVSAPAGAIATALTLWFVGTLAAAGIVAALNPQSACADAREMVVS